MERAALPETTHTEPVSAPYDRFCLGLRSMSGYALEQEGERLSLAFEPWFVESRQSSSVPCLRITFRKEGDRIVLETFVVEDRDDVTTVNLEAAHDALQAWMDCMSA